MKVLRPSPCPIAERIIRLWRINMGNTSLRNLIMFTALANALSPVLANGPYIYWGGGGLGLIIIIVVIVLLLRR